MLACGYEGLGRLWNVDEIVERAAQIIAAEEVAQNIFRDALRARRARATSARAKNFASPREA